MSFGGGFGGFGSNTNQPSSSGGFGGFGANTNTTAPTGMFALGGQSVPRAMLTGMAQALDLAPPADLVRTPTLEVACSEAAATLPPPRPAASAPRQVSSPCV